jgi:cytochrome c biogenesis protein CcdA
MKHLPPRRRSGRVRQALGALAALLACLPGPLRAAENRAPAPADKPALAVLFGAPNCPECRTVKDGWRAATAETAAATLAVIDVEQPAGFRLLLQTEAALGVEPPAADNSPVLYAGGELTYGSRIAAALPELLARRPGPLPEPLRALLALAGPAGAIVDVDPAGTAAPAAPAAPAAAPRQTAYFHLPGCGRCSRFDLALHHLEHDGLLAVARFDITTAVGRQAWDRTRARFETSTSGRLRVPLLAWDSGWTDTPPAAADLAARIPPADAPPFWEVREGEGDAASTRDRLLSGLTWPLILAGGLIDGINPCAFATAVFLVGYLLYLGKGRRTVLTLGLSFCAGVFATYLAIGLGLRHLLEWAGAVFWLKSGLYLLMGGAGLVLAVLHLRDARRFARSGRARDMAVGLSEETTRTIHAQVRRYTGVRFLAAGGFLLGAVVSALELVCTGQIYLPTLILINRIEVTAHSLLALLLYNVLFVLPLVGVTLLAAAGLSGKRLAELARRHVAATKIAMAALFLALAAVMLALAARDLAVLRFL